MIELASAFCCGAFFGAALYITAVQHPAAIEAGEPFAIRFFGPMYRRATLMQVGLAVAGTLFGVAAWWRESGWAWLLGAALLFAVIPFTLVFMIPINHQLLEPDRDPETAETHALLRKWATLHGVRTALSGSAFALMLAALPYTAV